MSDDLPPPRRPLFFPVVIATTFLSIIGISVGLLLGAQRDREHATDDRPIPPVSLTSPATSAAPAPTPSGQPCRPETQKAAAAAGVDGRLALVLHMRTGRSDVYICRDASDALYYHANNGGREWVEGKTALFLTEVERDGEDYRAFAPDGAVFTVSQKRLLIVHPGGREELQKAVV